MPDPSAPPIRQARRADLSALLDLYRQLHAGDPPIDLDRAKQAFDAMLGQPGLTVFVAEADGRPAATCTLIVVPNLTRGARPYGLIENVVTDAGFRSRGFGRTVLKAAISAAWRQDCYKVMLMTGRSDEATLRFYEHSGFSRGKTAFQINRP
ncbi:MAG: GNAT family N-acetyltransferase [Ferrovibrio sp.]